VLNRLFFDLEGKRLTDHIWVDEQCKGIVNWKGKFVASNTQGHEQASENLEFKAKNFQIEIFHIDEYDFFL
jgi:hypothetical protein